ncbi:glycosyltransferase family 39 protein [Oscillospiraceae bacterium OttesenSCG-928-G22]|nr:glycosyltransferase family 39 protein [Oscillospiraceae bacterium OttesenSCG-928-G22]
MKEKKKLYYSLVGALFLLAVAVRVWKFGAVPAGMNQDGAMAAVDAFALSQYGTDRFGMWLPAHFTAWGYGQMSVLLSYLMVPFIKLFGLSVVTARLPMLLVSLLAIFAIWRLTENALGKVYGILTLLFVAINPWQIMQSRWALDCNLLPHFLLFAFLFLYKGITNNKFLYLSMVFFAGAMYSYGIAWFTVPPLLVAFAVYLLWSKKAQISDILISAGVFVTLSLPILLVMIVNFFKLPTVETPLFTAAFFQNSVRSNDLLFFSENIGKQFLENVSTFVRVVLLQEKDLPWNAIPEFGTMYLFSLPFLIAGLLALRHFLKRGSEGEKSFSALLLIWLLGGVFAGVVINGVNINRINLIFYPLLLLISLGVYFVATVKTDRKAVLVAVCAIYLFSFGRFTANYFGPSAENLAYQFFDGFGDALKAADSEESDVVYITSYVQAPGRVQVSEILTEFHLKLPAGYLRGIEGLTRDGEALGPYNERYRYIDLRAAAPEEFPEGIFVVNAQEISLFSDAYEVERFRYFAVVRPK